MTLFPGSDPFQTEIQPAADNLDDNLAEGSNDTDVPAADNRKRNRNEQILSLHKQGESNVSIAKELGLGVRGSPIPASVSPDSLIPDR